jgi:hypothetical protein|nr:MAG TPA: hypothetical protein [Bacteriophage sp.]
MNTSLKVYKELVYIETFDGELIPTAESKEELQELLKNSDKFLDLGDELLSKSAIKRIIKKKIDEIDNYILHNIQNIPLRNRVQSEVDKRKKEGARINMDILLNIIERLSSEN